MSVLPALNSCSVTKIVPHNVWFPLMDLNAGSYILLQAPEQLLAECSLHGHQKTI